MIDPDTRCRHPVRYRELAGQSRTDVFPVCWRPAGHPGGRHLSEYAIRKLQERNQRRCRARPRSLAAAA
jgi:hypothetical protein